MAVNEGKKFEMDFKDSTEEQKIYIYRFKDGTANFAGGTNENVRFQADNICDFLLYFRRQLFYFELKSYKGKSIPFDGVGKFKGTSPPKKLMEMVDANEYEISTGYIFNFRDCEETYYIPSTEVLDFMINGGRKSFPIDWCRNNEKIIAVSGVKKKVRFNYDIMELLEELLLRDEKEIKNYVKQGYFNGAVDS